MNATEETDAEFAARKAAFAADLAATFPQGGESGIISAEAGMYIPDVDGTWKIPATTTTAEENVSRMVHDYLNQSPEFETEFDIPAVITEIVMGHEDLSEVDEDTLSAILHAHEMVTVETIDYASGQTVDLETMSRKIAPGMLASAQEMGCEVGTEYQIRVITANGDVVSDEIDCAS